MIRRVVPLSLALVFCTLVSTDALAQRRGFIIGIGVGAGLTTFQFSTDLNGTTASGDRESEVSIMTDFKIGAALSPQALLYWTSNVSWFSLPAGGGDDVTVATGIGGLGFTYALKTTAPSAYVNGGIGFSTWSFPFEEDLETLYGFGFLVGGGYEFAKHFAVDVDLIYGKPSEGPDSFEVISGKLTLNILSH